MEWCLSYWFKFREAFKADEGSLKEKRQIKWELPDKDWVKINVNAGEIKGEEA